MPQITRTTESKTLLFSREQKSALQSAPSQFFPHLLEGTKKLLYMHHHDFYLSLRRVQCLLSKCQVRWRTRVQHVNNYLYSTSPDSSSSSFTNDHVRATKKPNRGKTRFPGVAPIFFFFSTLDRTLGEGGWLK